METITQKINRLSKEGYRLEFETVFNKAFDNYKKIAIYAGFAFLLFAFVIGIFTVLGIVASVGAENLTPDSLNKTFGNTKNLEIILARSFFILVITSVFAPLNGGFLKMARAADKDEEFKMREFFQFYKLNYFKEIAIATVCITVLNLSLQAFFDYFEIPFFSYITSFFITLFTILTLPLIIFGEQKALDALQASVKIVSKQFLELMLLVLVAQIGAFVGLIALCIGMFFTLPFIFSMQYAIYESTIGFENETESTQDSLATKD